MQSTKTSRKRKTEELTPVERKALEKYIGGFSGVEAAAAEELQVHQSTLSRIRALGKGSPDIIGKIRTAIAA